MEEYIFTGYCRALDQSRMVEAEVESTNVYADCAWPYCPHSSACLIGQQLQQLADRKK